MWATRLWWLLRSAGLENVAVLDGGLAKWCAEDRPLCSAPCSYPAARFVAKPDGRWWADREEVERALASGGACTINALTPELHRGTQTLGYARRGRIAGTDNVAFSELVDPVAGTLRPVAELRDRFRDTAALERPRAITYCGGGIAATLTAFALRRAGHPDVGVYDGSLDEWSRDPALPMESDGPAEGD